MFINHISTFYYSNIDLIKRTDDHLTYPWAVIEQITTKRYGMCMNLNYAFSLLLTKKNYPNYWVKCFKPGSRSEKKEIYHLSIIVVLDNIKYFVDVGYGAFFVKPLILMGNEKVYYYLKCWFTMTDKELPKIVDFPVNIQDMIENNKRIYSTLPGEIELNSYVFERIYNPYMQQYIKPKSSSCL